MDTPLVDGKFGKVERADPFQAGCIDAVLIRVGASLVVRVDPALRAEIMLCLPGIELIQGEKFAARNDLDVVERRRHRDGAAHPAIRAIAAPCGVEAVAKAHLKSYRSTMT